jgi:hypothetical protein
VLQLTFLAVIATILILFLDNRYRVLPASIHDHLPTHHPGFVVTDVIIVTCSSWNLFSSCTLDPAVWHRVNKDLYLGSGWTTRAYLYFQRKREEDLLDTDRVVLDLKVSRLNPGRPKGEDDGTTAAADWEARQGGLWLRRTAKRHASDDNQALTSVDVLFGADAVEPRPRWEIKDTTIMLDGQTEAVEARVTIRRGTTLKSKKPVPRINDNGRFKIMQAADLHLTSGSADCEDPIPAELVPGHGCDADTRTLEFFERLLDEEKPDLVVLSGDQINGQKTKDAQTAVFKFVQPLVDRKLPWAAILGNHDDESNLDRAEMMALLEEMPYSLHSALTLYLLDTHSYSPDERHYPGYAWIRPNQIRWFKTTTQSLKKKHKEYTHIHLNMAFIHIPLTEYADPEIYRKGNWTEASTAPLFNSGFKDALVEEGIVFVSCGQ